MWRSVTAKGRSFGEDLSQFRSALQSATPRAAVTPIMIGACVLVYAAMVATGVPWLLPSAEQLSDWGANQGTSVVLKHEYWRLFTNVFLHAGFVHLGMNMWNLFVLGPLVERLYGNLAFAVIYLASGVGGAMASLATNPLRTGVGASGAICGVLGALAAFFVVHRRVIPKSILKSFRGSLVSVVVFMAVLGYFVPNIDQQAHIGGVVTGFLSGLLLSRPWPVVSSRWVMMRRLVADFLIPCALAAGAVGVVHRATAAIPPRVRLDVIRPELEPALAEYESIRGAGPSTLVLSRDFDDKTARANHLRKVRALAARAVANLAALRGVTIFDPGLKSMINTMVEAQSSQLAGIRAAERFLETGDPKKLNGAGGMLDAAIAARKAESSFLEQKSRYLGDKKLNRGNAGP